MIELFQMLRAFIGTDEGLVFYILGIIAVLEIIYLI